MKERGGGEKTSFVAVRHSGAGQPCVFSGKRVVTKGKKKRAVLVMEVIEGRMEVLRTH